MVALRTVYLLINDDLQVEVGLGLGCLYSPLVKFYVAMGFIDQLHPWQKYDFSCRIQKP